MSAWWIAGLLSEYWKLGPGCCGLNLLFPRVDQLLHRWLWLNLDSSNIQFQASTASKCECTVDFNASELFLIKSKKGYSSWCSSTPLSILAPVIININHKTSPFVSTSFRNQCILNRYKHIPASHSSDMKRSLCDVICTIKPSVGPNKLQ